MSPANGFRIATWNLRYDGHLPETPASPEDPLAAPDYLAKKGEQPWSTRRTRIANRILSEGVSLIGTQEGLKNQNDDLAKLLGDEWSWIGVGRNDGKESGEYNAFFYKKSDITVHSSDHFWLSNTPSVPGSQYPEAGSVRICTAAHITVLGKDIFYMNTHFDDRSDPQRALGASMILHRARYEAAKTGTPVLVTGDLNSSARGNDSKAYSIITGAAAPVAIPDDFIAKYPVSNETLPDFKLIDSRVATPPARRSGSFATWTDFLTAPTERDPWLRIDFIFGGSNGGWVADAYKVESNLDDDGVIASDHRPVFVDFTLKKN